jgi:DNA-binding NarL/FixJ family response regulator
MKPITVILADDHTILREGLRTMLESESDIKVIGEAENGRQAVELTEKLMPDVLVMDIAMPSLNGLEANRQIGLGKLHTAILMLSAYSDAAYVQKAMANGASGYLVKQNAFQILPQAIRDLHAGLKYFCPEISNSLRDLDLIKETGNKDSYDLTTREMEVLQLIAEGNPNKLIADILKISIKTVETHRQNVMNKLNIHEATGLTRYAIASGIIEVPINVSIIKTVGS